MTQAIKRLNKLAVILRGRRVEEGALELSSNEFKFELDSETKLPTNLFKYESYETNKLIEEFMLLANEASARQISTAFKAFSVLRKHEPPQEDKMQDLAALLQCHGVNKFTWKTNKDLSDSLDQCENTDDAFFNKIVRILTTRCMNEAQYFCTGNEKSKSKWAHFGLAMSHYTHFTSPIRRYADCLVHRFLEASLKKSDLPESLTRKDGLTEQVDRLNFKHRMAAWSSRASVSLNSYLYFKVRGKVEAEGIVVRVGKVGIEVAVEDFGVEGQALLNTRDWVIIKDSQRAHGRPLSEFEGMTIGVFDRVKVRIEADTEDGKFRNLLFTFLGQPDAKPGEVEQNHVSEVVVP